MIRYLLLILTLLSFSCTFEGEDLLSLEGLVLIKTSILKRQFTSSVTAIDVNDNQVIISGRNLDLVSEISILGEVTNQNSPLVNSYSVIAELTGNFLNHELEIISISPERIVAKGRWEKVGSDFQQRYDLITLDYNAPLENNFPFMIIREETPADKFEEIKIDDEIKVTGLQLESTGNHRDVITYDETNDEWTTGEISGQLEYIGIQ